MQKITLIAALDQNRAIGKNNDLPWHIPEDFAFFKQYTMGKPVLMGRKTWDSLPKKPLPGRANGVISRQSIILDGAEVFDSIEKAISAHQNESEIMIIGGAQIYALSMAIATDLRLTRVHTVVEADAYFPLIDAQKWREISCEHKISQKGFAFDWVHYQRVIE